MAIMRHETTNWSQLYRIGAVLGAGMGLLVALDLLPAVPEWPAGWGVRSRSILATVLLPVAGGTLVGILLGAAAHLGVRGQLRRRSRRS
jgi:hypothetical protein